MLGFETVGQATIRDGGVTFTNDDKEVCRVDHVRFRWDAASDEIDTAYACQTCGALVLPSLVEVHAKTHGWKA